MTQAESLLDPPTERVPPLTLTIGAVDYLNTVPLIAGLERLNSVRVLTDIPANQVGLLETNQVDLALCSSIDLIRCPVPLEVVPVGMLGCEGPTLTVRLYSSVPVRHISRVACDRDSHTSVELLRILLREQHGVEPELVDFDARGAHGEVQPPDGVDALLLIGDKVVTSPVPESFKRLEIDLGEAWFELTGLPFVFATWLCRAERTDEQFARIKQAAVLLDRTRLRNAFRIDQVAALHAPAHGWSVKLARRYLVEHLRFDLNDRARLGLKRFLSLAGADANALPFHGEC
jgi:chorismate dehydratase